MGLLVADIVAQCGLLHGVLHCAEISMTLPLKPMPIEQLDHFFRNNLYSAIELTREVCKIRHISKEGGSIVFSRQS